MSKTYSLDREGFLMFKPSLARHIGLESAVVLQRIAFLLSLKNSGREHEGRRWIWNTYEDWQRDHFPFMGLRTIRKVICDLETMGVLVSAQLDGRTSRQKFYRISDGACEKLTYESSLELAEIADSEAADSADSDVAEIAASHPANLAASHAADSATCYMTERTTERTTEKPEKCVGEKKRRGEHEYTPEFEAFWKAYPRKTGKGKASASFERIRVRPANDMLIAAIKRDLKSELWQREDGRFIPYPETWLNQRRWDDEGIDTRLLVENETQKYHAH